MDTDGLEAYADELFRAALRICGNWNDAEDLAQETLLAALQYDGAPADRRAWLHGVLRHKHYDLLRRKYKLPTVSIDLVPDMPETGAEPDRPDIFFGRLGQIRPIPLSALLDRTRGLLGGPLRYVGDPGRAVSVLALLNGEDGTGSSPYYTMAAKADRQAMRIRAAFEAKGCAMLFDSPTNQQFPILPNSWYNALSEKYAMTLTAKPDAEHTVVRFCTSWATRDEDVDALLADIASL